MADRTDVRALVGRTRELDLLRERLADALAGQGNLVLVGGEAGIGKSTLIGAIAGEARGAGAKTLAGHCYDLSVTPPYGAWRDLAARAAGVDRSSPLSHFAHDDGWEESSGQAALYAQFRSAISTIAQGTPLMLVLEDLHWADAPSLDLLRDLARHLSSLPLLLVVTYRVDEITRHHPLYQLLPALVRESAAERVELQPISPDATASLLRNRYPLQTDHADRLVAYLGGHAEGNPFYMGELLRSLEETGVLRANGDVWVLDDLQHVRLPALVRQVIDGRVARLGADTAEPLALAATIGQIVPIPLWATVGELDDDAVLIIVERATEAHLIASAPDGGSIRFAHALVREAIYAGILPLRRKRWHLRVAETLAGMPGADPDVVAHHFQQAGDARAVEWLIQAGERAQRGYAWLIAIERFTDAADALGVDESSERAWLIYRIGRLMRWSDAVLALDYLEEAESLAREAGDLLLSAYALFDRGTLLCFNDKMESGIDMMQRAVPELAALPRGALEASGRTKWIADALSETRRSRSEAVSAEVAGTSFAETHRRLGNLSTWLAFAGRFAEARAIGIPYVEETMSSLSADEAVRVSSSDASWGIGFTDAVAGRTQDAHEHLARAHDAYKSIDYRYLVGFVSAFRLIYVVQVYETDNLDRRRALFAEAESMLVQGAGLLAANHPFDFPLCAAMMLNGDWERAKQTALLTTVHGDQSDQRLASYSLCQLALWQGERESAWRWVHMMLPQGPRTRPGTTFFLSVAGHGVAARLALHADDLTLAREWIEARDAWLSWSDAVWGQAEGLLLWSDWHRASGDPERALMSAREALERASEPMQPLARAAVLRTLGQLATEARKWHEAEARLTESLAILDRCAAPFERALAQIPLARLYAVAGKHEQARHLLDDVRAVCGTLGARPALAEAEAIAATLAAHSAAASYPNGLSGREVEVLRLVATGMSNAEVAERLSISDRTVGQHLRSVYSKLEVSSRTAASRFAVDHGLT